MIYFRGYTDLAKGGCDTAFAVFVDTDESRLLGVEVGPGFNPDGTNEPGWAWGRAHVHDPERDGPSQAWIAKFLAGQIDYGAGGQKCLKPVDRQHKGPDVTSPFWTDARKVIALMRNSLDVLL